MKVNTCDNCGNGFWSSDDYETICYPCSFKLASAPRVEFIVKPPPIIDRFFSPKKRKAPFKPSTPPIDQKQNKKIFTDHKLSGYVYLMRADNGVYKIGTSKNVEQRLSGLRGESAIGIVVIHYFACRDARKIEKNLHKKYRKQRDHHEWFTLDSDEVKWFTSIKDYELD